MQIFCNALHKKRGRSKIQCFLVGQGGCCSVLLLPQKKVQVKSQFPVTKIQFHPSKSVPQKKKKECKVGQASDKIPQIHFNSFGASNVTGKLQSCKYWFKLTRRRKMLSHFGKLVNKKFGTLLHIPFVDLNNLKSIS